MISLLAMVLSIANGLEPSNASAMTFFCIMLIVFILTTSSSIYGWYKICYYKIVDIVLKPFEEQEEELLVEE